MLHHNWNDPWILQSYSLYGDLLSSDQTIKVLSICNMYHSCKYFCLNGYVTMIVVLIFLPQGGESPQSQKLQLRQIWLNRECKHFFSGSVFHSLLSTRISFTCFWKHENMQKHNSLLTFRLAGTCHQDQAARWYQDVSQQHWKHWRGCIGLAPK